jgi:hypothetical protein
MKLEMKREQLRWRLWTTLANTSTVSSKINCFLLDLGSTQIELEQETDTCNADLTVDIKTVTESLLRE